MSDSKSLNTSLLEVVICFYNEPAFIFELNDICWQTIVDAWPAEINISFKYSIGWNNFRHAPLWQFYLDCQIEGTGSPGIICIVCHQALQHPSEHGTTSMGKRLLPKAYIAKLHNLTESAVTELTSSKVDETALAILRRQATRQITIVSSLKTFLFNIQVWSILSELTAKMLRTGSWEPRNYWNWPRHIELLPHVMICISWYYMKCYIWFRAKTVI